MPPSACPLVQQRWALRRVKNKCAEGGALALLPKLAVAGASATGSATLSVKATMSGQEGGGRQSGDGVGGGEVGGERGETRGATAARSEQRALVRDSQMSSGTESVKGTRAPAAAVEIQSPVGWGRGSWEQLCAACAVGCGSVVRCVPDLRWRVHAPANLASSPTQADRRRQSRAGRSGVAREPGLEMLSMKWCTRAPTN